MKRTNCVVNMLLGIALLCGGALVASANRAEEVTLLLVPRTAVPLRIGLDLAATYPTLLVDYETDARGKLSLHGWTGSEWVNVTPEAFGKGDFFRRAPDTALVIEDPTVPFPESALPPARWCAELYRISSTEPRPLLHLIGQYYDFDYAEWKWFADRYRLSIDDINPEGLNVAWYRKPLVAHFRRPSRDPVADLAFWMPIRTPSSTLAETATTGAVEPPAESSPEKPLISEKAVEATAPAPSEKAAVNPLAETDSAEVMGAAPAEENDVITIVSPPEKAEGKK